MRSTRPYTNLSSITSPRTKTLTPRHLATHDEFIQGSRKDAGSFALSGAAKIIISRPVETRCVYPGSGLSFSGAYMETSENLPVIFAQNFPTRRIGKLIDPNRISPIWIFSWIAEAPLGSFGQNDA